MTVERDWSGRSVWLAVVAIAVPLLGVVDAVGPQPFAAVGFAVNLTVLGVAGGCALLGRAGLSSAERATVALAVPIGVLVLGTVAASALRFHLDRRLWAVLVALAAEAATVTLLRWRSHPVESRNPRQWPIVRPGGGGGILWGGLLAAAGVILAAAVTLSAWTAVHQAYPAFSALSAIRVGPDQHSVRIALTSEEAAPTSFVVTVRVGRARREPVTLRLVSGATWRKTIRVRRSAAVKVIAYRGTRPRTPYREVYLASRGRG